MTQAQQIEADLRNGMKITPMSALRDYGCFRLGARIYELRKKGVPILRREIKHPKKPQKHFAQYYLPHAK